MSKDDCEVCRVVVRMGGSYAYEFKRKLNKHKLIVGRSIALDPQDKERKFVIASVASGEEGSMKTVTVTVEGVRFT